MTDLLRLSNLVPVGRREEDGSLIIEARSLILRTSSRCCLLCRLDRNGTKTQQYKDFKVQAQPAIVEVKRQRFRCSECKAVAYEDLPDIDTDHRMTVRFREHLERQAVDMPFTWAAKQNGVRETLIRRIFDAYAARMLDGYTPKLPRVLGMDEIYLHRRARFVIGDVERRFMLDMRPSRQEADLRNYIGAMMGRENVEVVCQDMWTGYHKLTKAVFPRAVTVIDKYHVQRTANYGMDLLRKSLYASLSNRDRIALKSKRAIFLARWDDCKPETRARLQKLFGQHPALAIGYDAKEQFYDIYEAQDRADGEARMTAWQASLPAELEPHFKTSLDALNNWRPHILRYFEHKFTSGYVERLNGLIRRMDVSGAGYTFDVLRAKALLKMGSVGSSFRSLIREAWTWCQAFLDNCALRGVGAINPGG